MYVVMHGKSGRRKKTVTHVEAVSNSSQRSGQGPDRQALILIFAPLEIAKNVVGSRREGYRAALSFGGRG